MDPTPNSSLPQELTDRILRLYEGPGSARDAGLDALCREHPEAAARIRSFVDRAFYPVKRQGS